MTFFEFSAYAADAKNYDDLDNFLADMGFGAGVPYSGDNWHRVCEIIFAAAHGDIATLSKGMTSRAFAIKYGLPERTVQHWISGARTAPDYVIALVGYAVISDIPQEKITEERT